MVLKTFQAPKPFDDGRYRSLNGTLLDEIFHKTLEKRNGDIGRVYRTWDSEEEGLTWDDIQGVALTELHNKTIVGEWTSAHEIPSFQPLSFNFDGCIFNILSNKRSISLQASFP